MTNAGFSSDYKLFRKLMDDDVLIKIHKDDDALAVLIKTKMNIVLQEPEHLSQWNYDEYLKQHYTRKKLIIKINQIRQKNWYFDKLKV